MPGTLMRQIFAQALPSQQLFEAREPRFPYKLIKKQWAMSQKNPVNYQTPIANSIRMIHLFL
jgi:hypothetical protein